MKKGNGGMRSGRSERKARIVTLAAAGALAVACLGGWGVSQLQGASAQSGQSESTIKASEVSPEHGKAEFTVVSAKQYASIDNAPIAGKQVKGFANRGIAHEYEAEGGSFVLVKVKVRNVSAKFPDGGLLSTMFEPAGVTAADPVYLNCIDGCASNPKKPEYLSIDEGKTATFEIGWSVIGKGQVDRIDFDSEGVASCSF